VENTTERIKRVTGIDVCTNVPIVKKDGLYRWLPCLVFVRWHSFLWLPV